MNDSETNTNNLFLKSELLVAYYIYNRYRFIKCRIDRHQTIYLLYIILLYLSVLLKTKIEKNKTNQ